MHGKASDSRGFFIILPIDEYTATIFTIKCAAHPQDKHRADD